RGGTVAPPPERAGWKLVWSDEFEGEGAPDPKKWTYETGFVRNAELQYYTKDRRENARLEGGNLVIEAVKERFKNPNYDANAKDKNNWNRAREFADYTSASLTTKGLASWTYGRVEVRAKVPGGRGTWPAIWMLGTDKSAGWPKCGEIDIMEYVGFDPDGIHTTIHTGAYNHVKKTQKGHRTVVPKPYDDFHVYAIEWNDKEIVFFVDEQKVFAFQNDGKGVDAWPFDKPCYLLLNYAVGGAWGGAKGVDESIFPSKYLIDYVRVYEKADAAKP
ncbi:MAG: glycoside hydrolase family 16 protein, partial [Planctomycetota bacterium]